jgi:uncharacterized YigZ family protein
VKSENEIDEIRADLRKKFHDARHHVYAFMLGADGKTFRASDDGEPSNSSGMPVLGQIRSFGLTDILIVVVRYFGGTKLGVPGLINAYKSAAQDALNHAKIITKTVTEKITVEFDYPLMNAVMRLAKEENLEQSEQYFGVSCRIVFLVPKSSAEKITEKFMAIQRVKILRN